MDALSQGFQLEGLQVVPLTGVVSGPGGTARLDPKVMDVLVVMAGHAREVVLREDLVTRLWGQAVVTDDAVTRCFYELRRHLAQAGGDERFRDLIETVPKRGYRLNATVLPGLPASAAAVQEPVSTPRAKPPWRVVAGAAAVIVAIGGAVAYWWSLGRQENEAAKSMAAHSIAVLPFVDMSEGKDQGYLADGMTEEILNHLAQSEDLRVIARTSSFALRDTTLDVPAIGERLGVDYVLEGSVRRSGDRVRITAQLIDAATNLHAWSRTYDRTLEDLFEVQDDIAANVATALQAELSDAGRSSRQPSFEAYEQYLLGQANYHRRAAGDIERSLTYYQRAVEIDPNYARGWAALAGAYSLLDDESPDEQEFRQLQGAAARRAVELDPNLAVAHARLAQYYFHVNQRERGREHFQKAVALDPDDPLVLGFSTSAALARNDLPAAVDIWRRIVQLDPMSTMHRGNLATFLLAAGQSDEALVHFRAALELSPTSEYARLDLARGLVVAGEPGEAASLIQQTPPGLSRDLAFALLARDPQHGAAARATLSRLEVAPADVESSVALAEAHANNGEPEAAFRVLDAARAECDRRQPEMPYLCWHLRDAMVISPFLKPLHADPRWSRLVPAAKPALS